MGIINMKQKYNFKTKHADDSDDLCSREGEGEGEGDEEEKGNKSHIKCRC